MTMRVKICGLSTLDTLDAALDAGADFVGLVFFPKSPRNVSLALAATLAQHVRGTSAASVVALTVDADDALLDQICAQVRPDFLQLQGDESPKRAAAIKTRFACSVIKAIPVATHADTQRALDYGEIATFVLFDAKPPPQSTLPGGNGHAFDWRTLDAVKGRVTYMLAGGLTPDNVAAAIAETSAYAVDVSSGVERAPGLKDVALIRRFIAAAKGQG
jgi:phosphoribosylanthranilate isomerase